MLLLKVPSESVATITCARKRCFHSGALLTLAPQVFVNRVAQSSPQIRASTSHVATRAEHLPASIAPHGPFGIHVSDTQSTTSSLTAKQPQPAAHRGRGSIAELQLTDDRYRSSTDG